MRRGWAFAAAILLALGGCNALRPHREAAKPSVHYVLGQPYQSDGVWHYPRAQFDLDESGLAVVTTRASGLTADGEAADPTALAAAHPSLQLPALARITNLDTGLQVLVRVNDRGPAQRGRAIALTPRAIQLLGGAAGAPMRVRIQVQEAESREMVAPLAGADAPPVPVAAAPQADVKAESLAPPPGVRLAAERPVREGPRPKIVAVLAAGPAVPLRLPEQVWRVPPRPGALYVELGSFGRLEYAELMRQRMAAFGAETSTSYDAPRDRAFRVRIGPLGGVAAADAVVAQALKAGVADPRILGED